MHTSSNCAQLYGGAWWHKSCTQANPTGKSTSTKSHGTNYITWYQGGQRGDNGWNSWAEALYVLVPSDTEKIDEMKTEISKEISEVRTELETMVAHAGPVVMLRRKEVGNPVDFFQKTFAEYQAGFEANGEKETLSNTKRGNPYFAGEKWMSAMVILCCLRFLA